MALTATGIGAILQIEAQLLPDEVKLVEDLINDIRGKRNLSPVTITTDQADDKFQADLKAAQAATPPSQGGAS